MRSGRQPRVLYLAYYYPPSRASGVYRARATANHFMAKGWDVTVFAAPLDFLHTVVGSVDEKLAETVDPRIRVERPKVDMFPWEHDLRRFSRFRGTMPQMARKAYAWRQNRLFPEQYASWAWDSVRKALRMHARERFDVVVATGNPFASFAAAWLFRRMTGVPYVLDYRDSWTLNLFTDSPAFPEDHPAWRWERRVLNSASGAVFVNEALRDWHASRYPKVADRMMVVPNGWDPDLMTTVPPPVGLGERPLRYGYLGTVTNNQPVEEMVEAFQQARAHPDLNDAELNIHGHLGFFRNSPAALRKRLGLDSRDDEVSSVSDTGVYCRGPVAKTEVDSVYRDSDVLVFLAAGGRYVTSGKIFEYMASGRPIVSVHAPEIAAQEVLTGYPLWFNPNSLDPQEIAQSIVAAGKCARDLTPDQTAAAWSHAERFKRDLLLAPLEERLRGLVRRRLPAAGAGVAGAGQKEV